MNKHDLMDSLMRNIKKRGQLEEEIMWLEMASNALRNRIEELEVVEEELSVSKPVSKEEV
jgi:hypothetical protein